MMTTLTQTFNQHWQQLLPHGSKSKLILAFSGGVDSAVLLDLLIHLPETTRPNLSLAYFNHQLRADSDQEEQLVRQIAAAYQVPLHVGHWQHGQQTSEATARQARYDFLADVLQETAADGLITA